MTYKGKMTQPVQVWYNGRRYLRSREQWQRLRPLIDAKTAAQAAAIGGDFLRAEGIIQ